MVGTSQHVRQTLCVALVTSPNTCFALSSHVCLFSLNRRHILVATTAIFGSHSCRLLTLPSLPLTSTSCLPWPTRAGNTGTLSLASKRPR